MGEFAHHRSNHRISRKARSALHEMRRIIVGPRTEVPDCLWRGLKTDQRRQRFRAIKAAHVTRVGQHVGHRRFADTWNAGN